MELNEYQEKAEETAIYPKAKAFEYLTLKLCGEAGEVAEKIGKMFRDDAGLMTPERREAVLHELGDVLWYISALASELNYPLNSLAVDNLLKLKDRAERGKLHGDGDNR